MPSSKTTARQRTDQDAFALLAALGMTYREATICVGVGEWIVLLQIPCKPPSVTEFDGWPVRYDHIGKVLPL